METKKPDLYTKAVLTIIAFALVVLVFQNSNVVTPANASNIGAGTLDVNVVSIGGNMLYNNELDVKVVNEPKVSIDSGYRGLDVNVKNYSDFN